MTDVHTEHCCSTHGCKYQDTDCTVTTGNKPQSFPCERCCFEEEEMSHWLARASAERLEAELARRGFDTTSLNL